MSKKLYNCMECHPEFSCMVITDKEPNAPLFNENCKPTWYCMGEASVNLKTDTKEQLKARGDKNAAEI